MANYINILSGEDAGPLDIEDVFKRFVMNRRDRILRKFVAAEPHPFFKKTRYHDLTPSHGTRFIRMCPGRIVFLYRNPLDQLVSWFYFRYKWETQNNTLSREIIDSALDHYIGQFNLMMGLRGKRHILPVAYESLMMAPLNTLMTVLAWLDFPIDVTAMDRALAYSDKRQVKKYEENVGILNQSGRESPLIRSGKIGQWKEHFSEADLAHIRGRLQDAGIDLGQFIFE